MSTLPVLAECSRCGREFVGLPADRRGVSTWTDQYQRADLRPVAFRNREEAERHGDELACKGRVELTDLGRAALEEENDG